MGYPSAVTDKEAERERIGRWQFFPLYGLRLEGTDDGLASPLFSPTVTLVSESWVSAHCFPQNDETTRAGWSGTVAKRMPPPGLDPEYAVVRAPDSFIAVRNKSVDDAEQVATRVRAMLSASIAHSGSLAAFASNPITRAWTFYSRGLSLNKAHLSPMAHNTVIRTVISATKDAMRRSWNDGNDIQPGWRVSQEDSYVRIMITSVDIRKSVKFRIQQACVQLQRASCQLEHMSRLLGAVTAYEMLLRSREYAVLKQIMRIFAKTSGERSSIEKVIEARHCYVHNGTRPSDAEALSRTALQLGWGLFFQVSEVALKYSNEEKLDLFFSAMRDAENFRKTVKALKSDHESSRLYDVLRLALRPE